MYKLENERVGFTNINEEHLSLIYKWANNPVTANYTNFYHQNTSLEAIKELVPYWKKEPYFIIYDKLKNIPIGYCGLLRVKKVARSAELSIFIGDNAYVSKGYGTEALKLLCGYAFNYLNLHSLSLKTTERNIRARKAYEKIGFKEVGILRESYYFDGKYVNFIIMDLLKEDLK